MSNIKYVVSHLDQQQGPFDEQELRAKWGKGELLPIDYVYDEAAQDWVLLPELFPWAQVVEKAPPPPAAVIRRSPSTLAQSAASAPAPAMAPATQAAFTPVAKTAGAELEDTETHPIHDTPAAEPAKVKLVDGQGEIDLAALTPGEIELMLRDSSAALRLQEPHRIHVKPAEPVEVVWTVANQQVVGKDLELSLKALDEHGNVCLHYTDAFVVQVRGQGQRDITVTTQDGQAHVKIANTKSESWTLSLHYTGGKRLRLPEPRPLEWLAGPASRLELDGPHEYIAGLPLKVKVKAVDAFGNVAKNYQGTVTLEVKAS